MLWLPELVVSGERRRLPLSYGAASALAAALIGGASEEITVALREALSDPPLALWTVHRAWSMGCGDLRTLDALANWLTAHIRGALDWGACHPVSHHDEALAANHRRLAARGLSVATRARHLATGEGLSTEADEAFLLGLLHAADEWWELATAAVDARSNATQDDAGPEWLSEALRQLKTLSSLGAGTPVAFVARARQATAKEDDLACDDRLRCTETSAAPGGSALAHSLPRLAAALAEGDPVPSDFSERLEAAKLEAMAEFAAGAGHEINNPIAVIAGRAQLLLDGESNPQRRRELAVINTQAMRVYEMIADMMLFARPPRPKLARCDLVILAQKVMSEVATKAAERQIEISLETADAPAVIDADANQLAVALRAICDNALAAVERGGRTVVRVSRRCDAQGDHVTIAVADNGCGVSHEVREHIFDPFYCGRPAGRGLGMGLAKAWRIIANHQGRIDVESQPGQGATFTIVLPAGSQSVV